MPEQVYFEVQKNGIPEQDKANEGIVRFARELGRPLVGTADVHYLRREDFDNHSALLCVQTKSTLEAPKLSFDTNEFYLKDSEEMATSFAEWPEAVPTTLEIAERCDVEIELGKLLLPRYPTPDGEEPEAMLRRIADEGLRARYGDPLPAEAQERLEFELGVIEEMGFSSYFLIVWDFVRYAKENGIAVGPGRGSAAGSIVAYALTITDIDPLANDLLFERFLNPGRKSMPDIDIDFSVRGRERVIRYVAEKYGRESVAQIITFGKMAPRAATRDAARVLGFDYGTGDRLAKQIPEPILGRNPSFEECLKPGQELRKTYDSEPDAKKILDVAQGLEGIIRNNSIHAAAVVIADRPLQEIVPLQLAEDRSAPARGNGNGNGRQGRAPVQDRHPVLDGPDRGDRPAEDGLPRPAQPRRDRGRGRDHPPLARGRDRHQRDPDGRREDLRDALPRRRHRRLPARVRGHARGDEEGAPTEFDDIVALVSLYRPGAMRYIPDYAKGKRNPDSVTYPDERLRPITEPTYGCVLYQEQLMEIAKRMAGFSPAEADDLRKAIGKKKRELMATMKAKFLEGMKASGTAAKVANDIWSLMEAAADYSFNKSHAACYALIAYRTAYLKANYPAEYMAAVISSVMNTKDKVPFFVNRCEEMGIEVLPPDVNSSDHDFVVSEKAIRFGLDAVKNVGHAAVEAILRAREDSPIASIWDFCERVDSRAVNKRAIECLIKCGALDSTGATRKGMLEALPAAQSAGQKAQEDAQLGQGSIFDFGDGESGGPSAEPGAAPAADLGRRVRARRAAGDGEGDARHLPLLAPADRGARARCAPGSTAPSPSSATKQDGSWVTVGGIVTECKKIRTKSGNQMMFATLDDVEGQVEMLVFKADQAESAAVIAPDAIVLVRGRVDHKERGETKLVVQEAERFEPDAEEIARAPAAASAPRGPLELEIEAAQLQRRPGRGAEGGLRAPQGRRRGAPRDPHRRRRSRAAALGDGYRVRPSSGLQERARSRARPASAPWPHSQRRGSLVFAVHGS